MQQCSEPVSRALKALPSVERFADSLFRLGVCNPLVVFRIQAV